MSTGWRQLSTLQTGTDGPAMVLSRVLVAAATVALAARFLTTVLVNVPSQPGAAPVATVATAAALLAAAGALALGADATPTAGVGLMFVGVFGLLGTAVSAATLPAGIAVSVGSAVFVGARVGTLDRGHGAVLGVLAVSLVATLVGAVTGTVGVRPYTSTLTFLALGTLPVLVAADGWSLLEGLAAVAVVVGLGLTVPFVTGAVTLVGTGAVGTPLPVIALAVAGVVTAASAAVRERRWLLAAGVALVALAGVPATLPRALPFALGIAVLTVGVDR